MFYSTQDAISQGFTAGPQEKLRWTALRRIFKIRFRQAMRRKQYDLAAMFAAQAQFNREALDAENIYYMHEHLFEGERRV